MVPQYSVTLSYLLVSITNPVTTVRVESLFDVVVHYILYHVCITFEKDWLWWALWVFNTFYHQYVLYIYVLCIYSTKVLFIEKAILSIACCWHQTIGACFALQSLFCTHDPVLDLWKSLSQWVSKITCLYQSYLPLTLGRQLWTLEMATHFIYQPTVKTASAAWVKAWMTSH